MKFKKIVKATGLPVLVASLCCLAPIILVAFGLSTVAFAASLSDVLYGSYKWLFRLVGLLFLAISLVFYLRRSRGICTLDDAKKRRNEIINIVALTIGMAVVGYIVWLYVVVEYAGTLLRIWS